MAKYFITVAYPLIYNDLQHYGMHPNYGEVHLLYYAVTNVTMVAIEKGNDKWHHCLIK